jgi:hypothetical protein
MGNGGVRAARQNLIPLRSETVMNYAIVRNGLAYSVFCSFFAMLGCSGNDSTQDENVNDTGDSSSTCGLSLFDISTYDPYTATGVGTLRCRERGWLLSTRVHLRSEYAPATKAYRAT